MSADEETKVDKASFLTVGNETVIYIPGGQRDRDRERETEKGR